MTATHYEDIAFELAQEEYPAWEAEERQEMSQEAREGLDNLQNKLTGRQL